MSETIVLHMQEYFQFDSDKQPKYQKVSIIFNKEVRRNTNIGLLLFFLQDL